MRLLAVLTVFIAFSAYSEPVLIPPTDPQSPLSAYHELGIEIGLDYLSEQNLEWGGEKVYVLPPDFPLDEQAPEQSVAGLSFWHSQDGVIGALPGMQAIEAKVRQHFDDPIVLHNDVVQSQELAATIQPDHNKRFTTVADIEDQNSPVLVIWTGDLPDLTSLDAERLYVFSRFVNQTSLASLPEGAYQLTDWHHNVQRSPVSDYLVLETLKRAQRYPDQVVEAAFRSVLVAFELSQDAAIANRAIETASGLLRYGSDLTPNTPLLLLQHRDEQWHFVQRW
ncbi:hypothetical protein [Salinibius halmophilus]|uniref:hypothetical protein n=1 Tax=Salinibius halmophilus TaxID=1853216 RepID=UPI000E6664CC|nr:hypothetical protein [Salinibius halmophilus]